MSFADERAAIEGRFAANWSATTVKYENIPFTVPATSWVALTIRSGVGNQISLGNSPLHRYQGVVFVDIFAPPEGGTEAAKTLADTAEAIFRNASFNQGNSGQLLFRTPYLNVVGERNGWFQLSLTCPYHRDRIHA